MRLDNYTTTTTTTTTTYTHTHTRLTALFPGLPRWAGTRTVKPIWILLKQETVSGSGISWAICKSAPRSRQITTPASHHSVFYRPDALPAAQPTASHITERNNNFWLQVHDCVWTNEYNFNCIEGLSFFGGGSKFLIRSSDTTKWLVVCSDTTKWLVVCSRFSSECQTKIGSWQCWCTSTVHIKVTLVCQ